MGRNGIDGWWIKAASLAGVILMASPGAEALQQCKVGIGKKTGVLMVSAADVSGALRWGYDPQGVVGVFDNAGTCVTGSVAKNCTLGPVGSAERITPPPLCSLYLEDDAGSCSVHMKSCTPGARTTCPPDMERIGSWCIDRSGMSPAVGFTEAVQICEARGRSLCPIEALIECDTLRNGANYPADSCAGYTDGQGGDWLWTITSHAGDNANFYTNMTVYQDNNVANVQSTGIGSVYSAFCCTRVGAH